MKKQNQVFLIVAVLTLCIIDALPNSMTPVIADFAKLYPNVDPALLAQVVSVPSLVYAVSSLFSGIFLNKFGYKKNYRRGDRTHSHRRIGSRHCNKLQFGSCVQSNFRSRHRHRYGRFQSTYFSHL